MSWSKRVDCPEQDSHGQIGDEQRPIPGLGKLPNSISEGEIDIALDGEEILEQPDHPKSLAVAAASTT